MTLSKPNGTGIGFMRFFSTCFPHFGKKVDLLIQSKAEFFFSTYNDITKVGITLIMELVNHKVKEEVLIKS